MERKKNWYSIVQYIPNNLRGEVINVGVLLHDPQDGKLMFQLLDEKNQKIKGLLPNHTLQETYKSGLELLNFTLENLPSDGSLTDPNPFNDEFFEELKHDLPKGFTLSKSNFSMTNNPKKLFDALLKNYVGKEFLNSDDHQNIVSTKKYINNIFDQRKLLGTKVKTNAKLKPIHDISDIHYTIDFVYKNGVINLLQAVPPNKDRLNEWFAKMNTIIQTYKKDSGIFLFYKEDDLARHDKTLKEMLHYFSQNNPRVKNLQVDSKEFIQLCDQIEREGQNVSEFEKELAV